MQVHQPSSSLPSHTLIDLFSRFVNQLLQKEDKYPIFQQEWESFKALLTSPAVDVNMAYIHLATIPINLMQKVQSTPAAINVNSIPSINITSTPSINVNPSPSINVYTVKTGSSTPPHKNQAAERKPRPSFNCGPDTRSFFPSFSSLADEQIRNSTDFNNSFMATSPSGTLTDALFTKKTSSPESSSNRFLDILGTSFNVTTPRAVNYHLSFLTQKAKELREHCQNNSEHLLTRLERESKATVAADLADRTPLRRIKVFAKQGSIIDQPNQQNDLYAALHNLANQMQSNPDTHPYRNALIHY